MKEIFEMCSSMKVNEINLTGDGFFVSEITEGEQVMAIMPMQDPHTTNSGFIFYQKVEDGYIVYGEHECFYGDDIEEQISRAHRAYRAQDMAFKFIEVYEGTL